MKSAVQYLRMLPEPYASAAIIAVTVEDKADYPCYNLLDALLCFDWSEYAIADAKSWEEVASMCIIADTDTDTMIGVSKEEVKAAQMCALKDMGMGQLSLPS